MAKDTITIGINAELKNYEDIVTYIQDGIEKGLVDGVSDKALKKVSNRIKTALEQVKLGNFDAAFETLHKISSGLLNITEAINIAAGAAASNTAELNDKLVEAKQVLADLRRHSPKNRYRQITDSATGNSYYVRAKAGLDRKTVGMSTEEQWATGIASFKGAKGKPVDIDYGGKNWSVNSAIKSLVEALHNGTLALSQEIEDAIKEFGFSLKKGADGRYSATRQNLTAERVNALNAWEHKVNGAKQHVEDLKTEVTEARAQAETVKITAETGEFITPNIKVTHISDNVDELEDQYTKSLLEQKKAQDKNTNAAEEARDAQDKLTNSVDKGTVAQKQQTGTVSKAVTTFFGYQMIVRQLRKLWNDAIHTITELDKQLTNQAIVTNLTRQETWQLVETYQKLGQATGFTTVQIASVTTEYLRQGNTLKDALTLTEAAAKAARVAGIDAQQSVQYLTTAIKGFKLEASDALSVSDKFANLAAQAATNYEDLAIALSKVASQAALAGMSMDYTLALLTTGLDVTQEAPESIGTALKTVVSRMREISDYGETLEDAVDINAVERTLKYVNVALRDENGELRSTEEVLDELGRKWQDLSANQQAAVAKALAGTRQQARLVAILNNYDKVMKYQNEAALSVGATNAQMQDYLEGMEAAMNRLHIRYEELITSITNNDVIISGVEFLAALVEKIAKILKNPAGLIAVIATLLSNLSQTILPNLIGRFVGFVQKMALASQEQNHINEAFEEGRRKILGESAAYDVLLNKMREVGLLEKSIRPNSKTSYSGLYRGEKYLDSDAIIKHFNRNRLVDENNKLNSVGTSPTIRGALNTKNVNNQNRFNKVLEKQSKLLKKQEDTIGEELERSKELRTQYDEIAKRSSKFPAQQKAAQESSLLVAERQRQLADESLGLEARLAIAKSSTWTEEMQANAEAALENAKKRKEEGEDNAKEVALKAEVVRLGRAELDAKASGGATTKIGTENPLKRGADKVGKIAGKAMGAVAIASTAIQWGQEIFDVAANGMAKKAAESIEKAQGIQNKIYENRKLQNNLDALINSTQELNSLFVKSAENYEQLSQNRDQLIEALADGNDTLAYQSMTTDDLLLKAEEKQRKLQEEQNKLLLDLGKAIMGAAGNYDIAGGVLNVVGKAAAGAAVGATFGPWGALIGAGIGTIVGGIEEIIKGWQAAEAKGKVDEMIKTEEGRRTIQQYMQYSYVSSLDTSTIGGQAQEKAVRSMYASIIDGLGESELKAITEKYDYDFSKFTTELTKSLEKVSNELMVVSDKTQKFSTRITAAERIIQNARESGDEQTFNYLTERYKDLTEMHKALGDAGVQMVDALGLSVEQVQGVAQGITADVTDAAGNVDANEVRARLIALFEAMSQGGDNIKALQTATSGWSSAAVVAAAELIANGQTLNSVATSLTSASSLVKNIRSTQADWGNMSALEREQWLTEHSDFFTDENGDWRQEVFDDFMDGADLTPYIEEYTESQQKKMLQAGTNLIKAAEFAIPALDQEIDKIRAELDLITDPVAKAAKQKELDDLIAKRREYNAQIARGNALQQEANELSNLSLKEIVGKQQEQIEKLKEMYKTEEEALTESLNKRKEAYQKYFDSITSQEAAADYAQNRDQLIESISRLSGGTDATSRNKVADLRKQLAQIEKEEAKRKTEEARQAVLQNIDDQVTAIEEKFDKLLNNNQELLASMDENTEAQYLNYLATLNLTGEELQLRTQELGDLLQGIWTKEGRKGFNNVSVTAAQTPQSPTTEQDPQSIMNLSIGNQTEKVTLKQSDMQELLKQMFTWLNDHAGTHFIV